MTQGRARVVALVDDQSEVVYHRLVPVAVSKVGNHWGFVVEWNVY